ncbi:tetratricopeptide repeat protein [Ilyomonas limi]|uniref:Tetratricopeptide repeat protein n=1 Tax=Ilyomonas limi TaxID=2575867 RepID=A0A4U3L926_9BACT|nr:tetratricopeptide repeat protein [Ilyomonas limi]TKK70207.1 tetratricopeptide repeat protein [Ilyomonas limi]
MKRYFFYAILLFCTVVGCKNDSNTTTGDASGDNKKEKTLPPEVLALQQQVAQHPDSVGIRLQLAIALDSIDAYAPALKQMDTLIKKDSGNYGLWYTKAQIEEDAKDTANAITSYTNAIKVYPSADAMLSLANIYAEQKNPRSLLICNQVRQLGLGRSYDAACAFIAGVYNARTGQKELALNLFDQCIQNDYTYMEAYIEKGLIYFDSKQYRQALDVFSLAVKVNRLYSDAYYWMARCYEMMNVKDSAVYYFKQSLALDKESPETRQALKRLGAE